MKKEREKRKQKVQFLVNITNTRYQTYDLTLNYLLFKYSSIRSEIDD